MQGEKVKRPLLPENVGKRSLNYLRTLGNPREGNHSYIKLNTSNLTTNLTKRTSKLLHPQRDTQPNLVHPTIIVFQKPGCVL